MRTKRERVDEDDEEMDIDDDDDEADPSAPATSNSMSVLFCAVLKYSTIFKLSCSAVHLAEVQPSNKLHCSNLPQEVTNGVLAVLFQQYA